MLSTVGTIAGCLLAWLILWVLQDYRPIQLAMEVYFVDRVPVKIEPHYALVIFGVILLFSWGASALALLRLKRLSVTQALGEV